MRKRWGRPLAFLAVLIGVLCLNHQYGWSGSLMEALRELAVSAPFEAGALYIAATAGGCVLLALPGAAFAAIAGLLFDPLTGTVLCLVASTLGAALAFLAGRYFLKDAVRPWLEKSPLLKKLLFDDANRSGVLLLMITRLVPLFPYNLQNFAYGLTDIGLCPYILCTFLFMAPGAAAFTFGAAGISGRKIYLVLAAALLVLVTGAGIVLKRRFIRHDTH